MRDIRALAEAELEQTPRATLPRFALAVLDALDLLDRTDSETRQYVAAVRAAIARNLERKP